jgi:hypothetical protein
MSEQYSNQGTITTSTTSTQAAPDRTGILKRTQLIITNTSAAAVVTIAKGNVAAIQNYGIVLQPNGTYVEATDGGYICWQGPIQAVSNAAGSIAIVESFEVQ